MVVLKIMYLRGDKGMIQLKSLDKEVYAGIQWSYLVNDSLLEIGDLKVKILSYNNDTITMRNERQQIQKLVRRQELVHKKIAGLLTCNF